MKLSPFTLLAPFLSLSTFITTAWAKSATGDTVLVLLDGAEESEFSNFFDSLRGRGFDLYFRNIKDGSQLLISEFGERTCDHLIIFGGSSKALAPDVTPQSLVSFLHQEGNIFLLLNPSSSDLWTDFAREFEVDFDDRETYLIDHFNFDTSLDSGDHTTVVVNPVTDKKLISTNTPVIYKGLAHSTSPQMPLIVNFLKPSDTAYSFLPNEKLDEDTAIIYGTGSSLVSGFQTRKNSRIAFSGSWDLVGNQFWDSAVEATGVSSAKSGNAAFVEDVTKWTFQEKNVLKVVGKIHHPTNNPSQGAATQYRVKEEITYSLMISEFSNNHWQPYVTNDIQLDFTMLDPHLRIPLPLAPSYIPSPNISDSLSLSTSQPYSTFSTSFVAPDRHGVFTFRVDYRRPGWSSVIETMTTSVTPLRHDEYPRFITGAWVWYGGAISTVAGFLGFSTLWLGLSQ